jgi:hypothetical protein
MLVKKHCKLHRAVLQIHCKMEKCTPVWVFKYCIISLFIDLLALVSHSLFERISISLFDSLIVSVCRCHVCISVLNSLIADCG